MNWNRIEYEVRRIEKNGEEKYIVYRTNPKRSFVLASLVVSIIYFSPLIPNVPLSETNPLFLLYGIGVGVLLFRSIKIVREKGDNINKRFILVTEFDNMESAIKYVEDKKEEDKRNNQKVREEVVYRSRDKK